MVQLGGEKGKKRQARADNHEQGKEGWVSLSITPDVVVLGQGVGKEEAWNRWKQSGWRGRGEEKKKKKRIFKMTV